MSPKRSTGEAPAPRTGRRGNGGRWRVYVGRGVIWVFIALVIVNAGMNQYRVWTADAAPAPEEPQTTKEDSAFPEDAAAAFAAGFAEVYLQPESPDDEDEEEQGAILADFVPEDQVQEFTLPEDFTGTRVRIVQVEATDDQHGLVTLSAQVNGEPMHLQVPVYADGATALVVAGPPALLPAPAQAVLPEQAVPDTDTDTQAADAMEPVVSGFLAAYAETPEHLERYVEPGAEIVPLPGVFEFASVDALVVPSGEPEEPRPVQTTVTWQLTEGTEVDTLTQRYELTMVESAGSWYVRDIQGAAPIDTDTP